jgi:hypothetical protein
MIIHNRRKVKLSFYLHIQSGALTKLRRRYSSSKHHFDTTTATAIATSTTTDIPTTATATTATVRL